jgi:hypothetical protein
VNVKQPLRFKSSKIVIEKLKARIHELPIDPRGQFNRTDDGCEHGHIYGTCSECDLRIRLFSLEERNQKLSRKVKTLEARLRRAGVVYPKKV